MPSPGGTSVRGCRGPQGNHQLMGTVSRHIKIWGMIRAASQSERWQSHTNTEVPWYTVSDTKGSLRRPLAHTRVPATCPDPKDCSALRVTDDPPAVACLRALHTMEADGWGHSIATAWRRLVRPSAATALSSQLPEDPGVPADCPGPLVTRHSRTNRQTVISCCPLGTGRVCTSGVQRLCPSVRRDHRDSPPTLAPGAPRWHPFHGRSTRGLPALHEHAWGVLREAFTLLCGCGWAVEKCPLHRGPGTAEDEGQAG